jgi:hypothetical protein
VGGTASRLLHANDGSHGGMHMPRRPPRLLDTRASPLTLSRGQGGLFAGVAAAHCRCASSTTLLLQLTTRPPSSSGFSWQELTQNTTLGYYILIQSAITYILVELFWLYLQCRCAMFNTLSQMKITTIRLFAILVLFTCYS